METKFAPAERDSYQKVFDVYNHFKSDSLIPKTLNVVNSVIGLLNQNRQIVFANSAWLNLLGNIKIDNILGKRPGEIFNCIHAFKSEGGCGTNEYCSVCGAVLTILESMSKKETVTNEARITVDMNNQDVSFDFLVTAVPFVLEGARYTIVTLNDISAQKRRNAIENIFFHDILNSLGGLMGCIELFNLVDEEDKKETLSKKMIGLGHNLVDEVLAQRDLLNAENGDLKVNLSKISIKDCMMENISKIQYHEVSRDKYLYIHPDSVDLQILSDESLLSRVITNMLKNALESSETGSSVVIGAEGLNDSVVIYVKNDSFMPRKVQMQVFQRSFSTKSGSRGLGTYSMKLITEQYLKGKVSFESDKEKGTKFIVEIPIFYPGNEYIFH